MGVRSGRRSDTSSCHDRGPGSDPSSSSVIVPLSCLLVTGPSHPSPANLPVALGCRRESPGHRRDDRAPGPALVPGSHRRAEGVDGALAVLPWKARVEAGSLPGNAEWGRGQRLVRTAATAGPSRRLPPEGGTMDELMEMHHPCPACGSADVPTLIVRGSGVARHDRSLQCRRCHLQWSDVGHRQAC